MKIKRLIFMVATTVVATLMIPTVLARADDLRGCSWRLAKDFRLAPHQSNPNPDRCGDPQVWYFQSAAGIRHPESFRTLPRFTPDAFHIGGIEQWQGGESSGGPLNQLPAIGINHTGDAQMIAGIVWPKNWIRVHPSHRKVVVGWRSPVASLVSVTANFTDFDATCGDGARISVLQDQTILDTKQLPNGGSRQFIRTLQVQPGEFLYFIVGNGDNGDFACDSTGLAVNITPG